MKVLTVKMFEARILALKAVFILALSMRFKHGKQYIIGIDIYQR